MDKVEWEEVARRGRNHAVLSMTIAAMGFRDGVYSKLLGKPITIKYFRQFDGARWMDSKELNKITDLMKQELQKDPKYLIHVGERAIEWIVDSKKSVDSLAKNDYSKMTNLEIASAFKLFSDKYELLMGCAYSYIVVNRFYPELVMEIVMKHEKDVHKHAELFGILLALDRKTGIREEKESLLEIAKIVAQGKDARDRIQKHVKQYAYLGHYVFYGEPYTEKIITDRVNQIIEKGLEAEIRNFEKQQQMLFQSKKLRKEWKLSEEDITKIETVKLWSLVSNDSDEAHGYSIYHCKPMFEEIGKRLQLQFKEVIELTYEEILQGLNNKTRYGGDFIGKIKERYQNSAIVWENGKITLYEGKSLQDYTKRELKVEEQYGHITELKGMAASPGKAIGRVALIRSITEIGKVKKGEVIVASSTMPAFVPAMEKAVAVVTNEGGLLSHAAIVSREFGIPCVVGTKIATKVFKDGDTVEVDAINGKVKKII